MLVGNKSDLQDQRKVNINIDEVFNYLGTEILNKINLSNQQIIIEQEKK